MNKLLAKDGANQTTAVRHAGLTGFAASKAALYCLNGGVSIALVLLGGLFAGLKLACVFHFEIRNFL
jgi:hypothetical protein